MAFDAFISYSRAADGKLAPEIQRALGQLAKPFWKRRALRVFRDETTLDLTPELWPGIRAALDASGYFILLASPEAAKSPWVRLEIDHWLRCKRADTLLLALTRGTIVWDAATKDFDWKGTTALPESLRDVFHSAPHYVDFAWAEREEQVTLRDPRFHSASARMAARIHGIPLDEFVGADKREHQRTWMAIWTALSVMAFLAVASIIFGILSEHQRIRAESQKLAAQSELLRRAEPGRIREAVALARASVLTNPTPEGLEALWNGLQSLPQAVAAIALPANAKVLTFDRESRNAALGCEDGSLLLLSGPAWNHQQIRSLDKAVVSMLFDGKGGRLFAGTEQGLHVLRLPSLESEWSHLALTRPQPLAVVDDGRTLVYIEGKASRFMDIMAQKEIRTFSVPEHHHFLSTADDEKLALLKYREGSSDGCGLWNLQSRERIWQDDSVLRDVLQLAIVSSSGRWLGLARSLSTGPNNLMVIDRQARQETPAVQLEHRQGVRTAEFTPDEQGIVTGSSDGTCRLWSLDGKEQWRVDLQVGVHSLKIAESSTILVVATDDGVLRSFDRQSGREWVRINVGSVPECWAVSPDGRWLLVADASHQVKIWELTSGSIVGRYVYPEQGSIVARAATPDGRLMAVQFKPVSHARDSDDIQFLETQNMSLRSVKLVPELPWVFGAAFDRGGAWFATLSHTYIRSEETLQLWDVKTGEIMNSLPAKGGRANLQVSGDGNWVAATWMNSLSGSEVEKVLLWDRGSNRVAVARDGTWMGGFLGQASCMSVLRTDGQPDVIDPRRITGWQSIRAVEPTTRQKVIVQGDRSKYLNPPPIDTLARACWGQWQPEKGISEVSCYDGTGNLEKWRWQVRGMVDLAWFIKDRWLVFGSMRGFDATVSVWDAQTQKTVLLSGQASVAQIDNSAATVTTVGTDAQSHLFALTAIDRLPESRLVIQALQNPSPKPRDMHPASTERSTKPVWSEDARTVASVKGTRLIVNCLTASGSFTQLLNLQADYKPLGISSSGRYFIAESSTELTVYDLRCGRLLISIPRARKPFEHWEENPTEFSFAEAQALLAVTVSERQVRIWNIAKREELVRLSPERLVRKPWVSEAGHSLIAVTTDAVDRYLWQQQGLLEAAGKRLASHSPLKRDR